MRFLALASFIAWAALSARAQYFGNVVYTEGFDTEEHISQWQITDTSPTEKASWKCVGNVPKPFSAIDPSSTGSAELTFTTRDTRLTIVSPEIDLAGKSGLQAGFYAYELRYCLSNEDFRFSVSADNGITWHDMLSMPADPFSQVTVNGWELYRFDVPREFEGKKVRLRFYLDASDGFGRPQGLPGYIDGVFISEAPEVDLSVTGINYSTNDKHPTYGAFGAGEPLEMTLRNSGSAPLTSATVFFSVNDGEPVEETFTPVTPLAPRAEAVYRFTRGADLSAPRSRFAITCGARADSDPNPNDNTITGYAENETAAIPYTPDFANEADLDNWKTEEFGAAYWEYDWNRNYWYIEPRRSGGYADAYLISRPVWLEKGKTYRAQFSATSAGETPNSMAVYVSPTADVADAVEIWANDAIDAQNASDAAAVYACESTGPHYFIFKCYSSRDAGKLTVRKFAFHRRVSADAAIVSMESPRQGGYMYSAAESVSVTIANKGAVAIPADAMTIKYSVDGQDAVSEKPSASLEPGESTLFTFASKPDLSVAGHPYSVKVWVDLNDDGDTANNSITTEIVSTVTSLPYIPDFGKSAKSPETSYWTVNDRNGDGHEFTSFYDPSIDTRVYCFGGGMTGHSTVTVPEADEQLLSRPMKLEAGDHKLVFMAMVGMADVKMPLDVVLYRDTDGHLEKVLDVWKGSVTERGYRETVTRFSVDKDGIYRLGFEVVGKEPLDFRVYLGDIRVCRLSAVDLSIENVLLPASGISSIVSMPVGVTIRNNGTSAATSFTMKAESESTGAVTCAFDNVALEPDGTYEIYFPENLVFDSADRGQETLVVSVETAGDGYTPDNTAAVPVSYREAAHVPYNPAPDTAIDEWMALNHNRDLSRFRREFSIGKGYLYSSDGSVTADDELATPGIALEKDKVYSLTFSYYTGKDNMSGFSVYALDPTDGTTHEIAAYGGTGQENMTQCLQYFRVPASGVYNICFRPDPDATSLFVSASVKVEESPSAPDLRVTAVKTAKAEGVLGDNETVTVEMLNAGSVPVQGVPVSVEVGDMTYSAVYTRHIAPGDESHQIAVTGIDLSEPGTYTIKARACSAADANPDDNSMTITVKSLPVTDVAVAALVSPVSGKLGESETVAVSIENRGKGDVTGITLTCSMAFGDNAPVILSDNIEAGPAQGEKLIYEFPATVDMSAEGTYTFTINATVENDVNPVDNTLVTAVVSSHKGLDAGVKSIDSPADGVLSAAEPVTVTVANYSEVTLYDVPITATVTDGQGEPVATLSGVIPVIEGRSTALLTFDGTVDMLRPGTYSITAGTALPGDADPANDACSKDVKCFYKDLGVTAIISPVTGVSLGATDVTVEITNFGEATVKDFPVSYRIGAMPQLATVTESVSPGESLVYTFPVKYEFTAFREYTVMARTMLPDDINPDNDACETTVTNLSAGIEAVSAGGIVIGPNPTDGHVRVTCASVIYRITIYDMTGRTAACFDNIGTTSADLSLELPAGHYIMAVDCSDCRHTSRLIMRR